jgi:colicin import membrane protein
MTDTVPYKVPKEPGRWRAITLAAIVHAALLALLWIGVRWQSETPVAVEAEIWSQQARDAAPRPQPPPEPEPKPEPPEVKPAPEEVEPPAPKPPDIALEQEKKRLIERKAAEKHEKALADAKKKADAEKKAAADKVHKQKMTESQGKAAEELRQQNMAQIQKQAGAGGAGDAPKAQGSGRADTGYVQRVGAKIKSNTVFNVPDDLAGNPSVEYAVELLPDGSLRGLRKLKSSGVAGFDEAVQRAIEKSQPYPPDKSGLAPSGFTVSHKPKDQ